MYPFSFGGGILGPAEPYTVVVGTKKAKKGSSTGSMNSGLRVGPGSDTRAYPDLCQISTPDLFFVFAWQLLVAVSPLD